jgi:hypothetical protein
MSHPLPGELPLHLVLLLYIINVLEVEVAGVSPSEHPAYLDLALCMPGLLSVVFFCISCCPQLGFYDKLMQDVRLLTKKKFCRWIIATA